MKVKIEFYTKCFGCLYENPEIQNLTWDNGSNEEISDNFIPNDEDLGIMLNQLHAFDNITCINCGNLDMLAFAIQKVNDKPYHSDEFDEDLTQRDSQTEYQIHSQIQEFTPHGLIKFHMKNGKIKVGEVTGIMTRTSNGSKIYPTKIYQYLDLEDDLSSEFGELIDYEHIELSEIGSVEFFMPFEYMYQRNE